MLLDPAYEISPTPALPLRELLMNALNVDLMLGGSSDWTSPPKIP